MSFNLYSFFNDFGHHAFWLPKYFVKGSIKSLIIDSFHEEKIINSVIRKSQEVVHFDTNSNIIEILYKSDDGQYTTQSIFKYNEKNLLIEIETINNKINKTSTTIFSYVYDANDRIIEKKVDNNLFNEIIYNNKNQIVKVIDSFIEDEINPYTEYKYDERNRVVKILVFDYFNDEVVEYIELKEEGLKLKYITNIKYKEDEENQLIYFIENIDLQHDFSNTDIFIFNEFNGFHQLENINSKGLTTTKYTHSFEYDKYNNVIELNTILHHSYDDLPRSAGYKRIIEYREE